MAQMKTKLKVIDNPFTVTIDSREQIPWLFERITKRVHFDHIPIYIPTKVGTLQTGDYSIEGHHDRITIERKSPQDMIQTITKGRERFERELERMQTYCLSAVVIECEWKDLLIQCRDTTQMNPVSIDNTILAWMYRYDKTHWVFRPSRFTAAKTTFKLMDRYYRDLQERLNNG